MVVPDIKGHNAFYGPSYAFLVSNGNRHVLFDLGVRKDLSKGPPSVPERINKNKWTVTAEQDVAEIIDDKVSQTGVASKDIEAVIFSHHHWDHTGNLSLFPTSTELVVGPGFKDEYLPAYPTDPKSSLFEPDLEGRTVTELDMSQGLKIGRFEAFDYFGDGSFYLLSAPGHSVGHICGLARVTTSPSTFIFMGGDAVHHCGEFRPTQYLPFPKTIKPSPFVRFESQGCPGELLQKIHPEKSANSPYFQPKPGFNHDHDETVRSIEKLEEFDADEKIFTIIAHDLFLLGSMPLFPASINDWYSKDLDTLNRWKFVHDFQEAVDEISSSL